VRRQDHTIERIERALARQGLPFVHVERSREVIEDARRRLATDGTETVLFIDEVHRFSKTQQDSLLSAVEDRFVILVAATTENPFFSVISPLLSRSLLLTLQPLTDDDIETVARRALDTDLHATIDDDAMEFLKRLDPPTTLREIKDSGLFDDWSLVRQGRLSTMAAPETFVAWMRKRYPKAGI